MLGQIHSLSFRNTALHIVSGVSSLGAPENYRTPQDQHVRVPTDAEKGCIGAIQSRALPHMPIQAVAKVTAAVLIYEHLQYI